MQLKQNEIGIKLLKSLTESFSNKDLPLELSFLIDNSFYYLGWMYYKESNFLKAADNFGKARSFEIGKKLKKDSYFMQAWSYFSKKDYKNAALKFEGIYNEYYPGELGIKAYFQMGKSYENLNNNKRAIGIYKKIYEEFPESPYKDDALYEIIIDLLNKKELAEANKLILEFGKSFSQSNLYKNILILQAETLISDKRFSEAFSIYSFYLKKYKDDNDLDIIYYWGAYCANKMKDYETAKEYFDEIIDNYQDSTFYKDALNIMLIIYKEEKNYKKEEVIIKKILEVEKDWQKGEQYNKRLKELELIKQGYDDEEANLLIKAEKGDIKAQFKLAAYYYQEKDRKKGLKMIKDIAEKDSKKIGSQANLILGDHELENKDYTKAIKIYLKTISAYKTTKEIKAEALYKTGFCYFKLDKYASSKKVLAKLKSNFGDSDWAKKGLDLEKRMQE